MREVTPALGYKVDRPDGRDWKLGVDRSDRVLGGSTGPSRRRFSWLDRCAPVRTQPAQNCVNEALARAVHTASVAAGAEVKYPSCLADYALGRQLELGPDAEVLPDVGSYPRLVMRAARDHGMVPLASYPDTEDPTRPVPFDVLAEAWHAKLTGFWRVDVHGADLLCAAIERGHIPIFGRTIGDDYLNLGAEVYDGRRGDPRGGHMEAIVGYDLDAPLPYFEVMGSWGTGFARGGVALCSVRALMVEAHDLYVVDSAPRI